MRSAALVSAVFALSAIAQPPHEKRDIVTDFQVVVETVYVTEDVVATAVPKKHHHHHHHHHHNTVVSVAAFSVPAAPPSSVAASSTSAPAPATSAAAPAPAPSAPASGSPEQLYLEAVMNSHNVHRLNHSAAPLTWSSRLAEIAMVEANICNFTHDTTTGGGGYGQNIAAGTPGNNVTQVITGQFYNGEMPVYAPFYGLANPDFTNFASFGHFTQVVWKATTEVGCYTADCSAQGLASVPSDCAPYFTVCNYYPAGNMGGEYGENIGEPLGHPTVNWAYDGDSGATWVGK